MNSSETTTVQPARPWTHDELAAALPGLSADANKYTRGKLVVIAGSARYPGAAVLAARASQRMGAGYTEVITAAQAIPAALLCAPSLVVQSFEDWDASDLPLPREGKPVAICMGSGFVGATPFENTLVDNVLAHATCPVLIDGGGLKSLVLDQTRKTLKKRTQADRVTVITPHGGEAARLAEAFDIRTDNPEDLAMQLATATGAVVALKGPDTFVSDGKQVYLMDEGTSALAKAGTGDVLAGMIGALLAQGVSPMNATILGTTLHAYAGKAAANALTEISVIPEDVIDAIPSAINMLLA